jgi:hypothetical protein
MASGERCVPQAAVSSSACSLSRSLASASPARVGAALSLSASCDSESVRRTTATSRPERQPAGAACDGLIRVHSGSGDSLGGSRYGTLPRYAMSATILSSLGAAFVVTILSHEQLRLRRRRTAPGLRSSPRLGCWSAASSGRPPHGRRRAGGPEHLLPRPAGLAGQPN